MASLVLSSVGGIVGNAALPGLGGALLSYAGYKAGQAVDSALGITKSSSSEGARLQNLSVQDSSYGAGIPVVYGQMRLAGNVIWCSDLIETAHQETTSAGKGGVSGSASSTRTTYTYSVHCAIALCAGPIQDILTIWADSKVLYENGSWKSGVLENATFYMGDLRQAPDPFMESLIGTGQVPGYGGVAYVVLESLQLANFGNRLPSLTFEILAQPGDRSPLWQGALDAEISQNMAGLRNGQMPPLLLQSAGVKQALVGGYTGSSGNNGLCVVHYDVSDSLPVEVTRVETETVATTNLGSQSWELSPDGRFLAMCFFDGSVISNEKVHVAIYDTQAHCFGGLYAVARTNDMGAGKIGWLDSLHFAIPDVQNSNMGVRVFARAGCEVVDCGFFNVFGSTAGGLGLFGRAQFTPLPGGGLMAYAATVVSYAATLYARPLFWSDGALSVGDAMTVVSKMPVLAGSGAQCQFVQTGDREWTLFYAVTSSVRLFSFEATRDSVSLIRPVQILTNAGFSLTSGCYPLLFGRRLLVVSKSLSASFYQLTEISLGEGSFSIACDQLGIQGETDLADYFAAVRIDSSRFLFVAAIGSSNDLAQVAIVSRRNTAASLRAILEDILQRSGYAAQEYDMSALEDVAVSGYALSDPMSAAAAIEPLQTFAPFDLVETDALLKAVLHGPTVSARVDATEWQASAENKKEGPPLCTIDRRQELDLPLEISLSYADPARDYETGTQRARRSATQGAQALLKINLPVACSATEAKRIAESRLYTLWAERETVRLRLSRAWLGIDVGDVLDLGDRLMRVAEVDNAAGLLDIAGPFIARSDLQSFASGDAGGGGTIGLVQSVSTNLYVMDLPLLRATDDQPGVYFAATGAEGWRGATLWKSSDSVNYAQIGSFAMAATAGYTTSVLGEGPFCFLDRNACVDVQMVAGNLSSCTLDELLNGAHAALCGDELIQFQTATLIGTGLYRLQNILRGRLGTESEISGHARGERFVLLDANSVQFLPAGLTDRGKTYAFEAPSWGATLGEAAASPFCYGLKTLQPLSPVHLKGVRSAGVGSDLTLSWIRRARRDAGWVDYIDVPLDEDAELYDVEIMNGTAVVRTFADVGTTSVLYDAAAQIADWTHVPASFVVNVYQKSGRYGRGQAATATV